MQLEYAALNSFIGDVHRNIAGACSVSVREDRTLAPMVGVSVRFRVLSGPLELGPHRAAEVDVKTDHRGIASLDARFTSHGPAMVGAELPGDPISYRSFRGHSDQTTHELFLIHAPVFAAEGRAITARILARDHHGAPVTGASLVFEGAMGLDTSVSGAVTEIGNGEYEGRFETNRAGDWTLITQDRETLVTRKSCVWVVPGEAHVIRLIGPTDPRLAPPYERVSLKARLEDRFGNAIDPHRIRCAVGGGEQQPYSLTASDADFQIAHAGYGFVSVNFSDSESATVLHTEIHFAAAWGSNPGAVQVGSEFRTRVFGVPPPGRPTDHATISIRYDPEQVSFRGAEPVQDGPELALSALQDSGLVEITVRSQHPLAAEDHPGGIPVASCRFQCESESNTILYFVGRMSPSREPWELCFAQKGKLPEKCVCINVIFKEGDAKAQQAGLHAANQIVPAIAGNVDNCCPRLIIAKIRETPIAASDWNDKIDPLLDHGKITSNDMFNEVVNSRVGIRPHCFNIYMIPIAYDAVLGETERYPPGRSVIDPDAAQTHTRIGAHEFGHAAGLDDEDDPDNLMRRHVPVGMELTQTQCQTIWQNIDYYENC